MNAQTRNKLLILAGLGAIVGLFFALGLDEHLTLAALREQRDGLQAAYHQNPFTGLAVFFVAYVVMAALSLPGASIMGLAAGAIFGLVPGIIVVSFASSIGALLAALVSRYLIGHWVQRNYAARLERINTGVEREGAFYLFTMRLIPAFPFFLINLAMGLTTMNLWTFYWVSQVGMLPGTAVFVNAGVQLAEVDSLSGILSLDLILSFAAIGLLPLVLKKLLGRFGKRPEQLAEKAESEDKEG